MNAREQSAVAGMWRPAALALREHEPLAGLPLMCGCGHSAGTKYQREKHVAQAVADALTALPDPEPYCAWCPHDSASHKADGACWSLHCRCTQDREAVALPDPEQAVREALDKVLAGYSNTGLMDLWWTASGDDWPVPEDMPRKFLTAIRDREARP